MPSPKTTTTKTKTSTSRSAAESDSRFVRPSGDRDDLRVSRGAVEDASRTETDGTMLSLADRQRMIRSEFSQEALPQLPAIPGWHLCWLNPSSTYDPISKRMRMGYRPVTYAALRQSAPGFEVNKMQSAGDGGDAVVCNEMHLYMIEEEMYQAIMREFHHNQPASEEEAIRSRLESLEEGQDANGRSLMRGKDGKYLDPEGREGFEDLARVANKRAPRSFA